MNGHARTLRFAYYCSGHGYGHATRVSAFACHLLSIHPQPTIYIVSSAPQLVFADSVALGAHYRYAEIDPVIVQPLAYRVDRQKSVDVLQSFLRKKESKVEQESQWLREMDIDCVLSDAAFLGCLAANDAGIPSVLITNFSFDSVYSYLSTSFVDVAPPVDHDTLSPQTQPTLQPDVPIPRHIIEPMVDEIFAGYRCADLLLRLPGAIPMPSFSLKPSLPSPDWVDVESQTFTPGVIRHLLEPTSSYRLHPPIPFPFQPTHKPTPRSVRQAPLLVRSPSPSVYTPAGRAAFLASIGVPERYHDSARTRILIVSFGGQVFHKPHSRTHSRASSAVSTPRRTSNPKVQSHTNGTANGIANGLGHEHVSPSRIAQDNHEAHARALTRALRSATISDLAPRAVQERRRQEEAAADSGGLSADVPPSSGPPLAAPRTRARRLSLLTIPGAPPVTYQTSPVSPALPIFVTIPPSPDAGAGPGEKPLGEKDLVRAVRVDVVEGTESDEGVDGEVNNLLPDDSWIAVVCGVSKEWANADGEALPDNFFVAPRDVYMPDLTAVADVLLGKLGYGTVSECVDACTPFVFVSRPLFIEEHGLRLLLDRDGVGVELPRASYEMGEWAAAVREAWTKGKDLKTRKRQEGETGKRKAEGRVMAEDLVNWVQNWHTGEAVAGI
ncbi:hypothetical protein CERSUDRAFT_97848 [Gelatoporia subvermispora B]|uniref:Uncharacterized protein n=1 Tax=Ceriporiopsis subvermispora (strain B) TaxID=914234 RepID=M2R4W4_CERS8|nr:hypothetical protein CERSUDRAFT_97848 [Gelatoporia subvermispora B]